MSNEEVVQELDSLLGELRGLTLVTAVQSVIERVEGLKTKLAPVEEEPEEVVEEPTPEPVVEAPVEPPVEAPVAEEAPVEPEETAN